MGQTGMEIRGETPTVLFEMESGFAGYNTVIY